MLFDKNTFIVPAASSDTHVYLKNTDGVVIFVIDPLSIVSLFTVGKEIRIKTKSDLHILSFDTSVNAISALPTLRASLDSITAQNAPLTGGGAINYVAKFTPNGTTISNSILYDNGTGLGIGTITPLGLLHIKSTSGITFRTESSTGAVFNINDNNTISFTGYNVSITGTFKYVDGHQATGYILTSDLNGNAIWQAPALLNLQQVLTNGSSTGGLGIKSPDGLNTIMLYNSGLNMTVGLYKSVYIDSGEVSLYSRYGGISTYDTHNELQHSLRNYLNSPLNEVSQNATTPLGIVTLQQLQSNLAAAPKKYTETASSFIANVIKTITHNIGNTAISITLWDSTTGDIILGFDANNRTLNSVDIDISVTGNYDIVIIG